MGPALPWRAATAVRRMPTRRTSACPGAASRPSGSRRSCAITRAPRRPCTRPPIPMRSTTARTAARRSGANTPRGGKKARPPSHAPGAWTVPAEDWVAYTFAVPPASGPLAPLLSVDRAVAVGSRLRFEAEGGTGSVALRLYDDGVLVAATTDTGAGILATGHRGGITGSMEAASDEGAFENVTFGDIDQSTPTPRAPVVTISALAGPLTGVVAVTATFTDPNQVGGVRSELYVDGVLD